MVSHIIWVNIHTSDHSKQIPSPLAWNGHCLKLQLHHRPHAPYPATNPSPPLLSLPGPSCLPLTFPALKPPLPSGPCPALPLPGMLLWSPGLVRAPRSGLRWNVTTLKGFSIPLDLHYSLLSPLPGSALLPRIQCHENIFLVLRLLICCLNYNIRSMKVRICYF